LVNGQPAKPCNLAQDLQGVVDAWDRLPAAVKAGIVAMVKSCR
jgi:hypothetical protein